MTKPANLAIAQLPERSGHRGRLAQLVEHLVYTERVGGSSPSAPTTISITRGIIPVDKAAAVRPQGLRRCQHRRMTTKMISDLPRIPALLLAVLLVLLAAWSLSIGPAPAPPVGPAVDYSDVRLYQDMASRIAAGESYYRAATSLQRAHGFPTRPFVTVRLPTLVMAAVWLGWGTLRAVLAALLLLAVVLWYRALAGKVAPGEQIAAALLVLAGGAMVSNPGLVTQHELWAGILLTIALALRVRGNLVGAVLAAGLALAIRELALPFVLLAGLFALVEWRWRELAAWSVLAGLFALALALHAQAEMGEALPSDLPSQGWAEHRGPAAPLRDLADVSLLTLLPRPLAWLAALLPLYGWLAAPERLARFAVPLFVGYMALLALFAREQNFYWAIMLLPAYLAGLAFLPRLARDLAHALLARRAPAL